LIADEAKDAARERGGAGDACGPREVFGCGQTVRIKKKALLAQGQS
jgi:hypothetical protein